MQRAICFAFRCREFMERYPFPDFALNHYLGWKSTSETSFPKPRRPMFRFFRQLRQQLFSSRQMTRYLFYALGEIVLVVLGILIALQIDTWNDQRKLQARQAEMLTDLRADLEETRKGLTFGQAFNGQTLQNYRTLVEAMEAGEASSPKIDSASSFLPFFHVPRFTRTAYESIKSQGLDLIADDDLKRQIAGLYENTFLYLIEDQTRLEWSMYDNITQPTVNRYLRYKDNDDLTQLQVYPVDFEKMKADPGFSNFLSQLILVRAAGIQWYEMTIQEIDQVIAGIDRALENLKR